MFNNRCRHRGLELSTRTNNPHRRTNMLHTMPDTMAVHATTISNMDICINPPYNTPHNTS